MSNNNSGEPMAKIGRFGLHIIKAPSGKYIYVGTIPMSLMEEYTDKFGLRQLRSKTFNTEEEAINYYNNSRPQ